MIAFGEDVNTLMLDIKVYSNTGGQASLLGAITQFAAQGKRIRKKGLGMIATTYGYVYVAQIAIGTTDHAQTLKAIREVETWHNCATRATSGKPRRTGRNKSNPYL